MTTFGADAQYNDWKGTVAADEGAKHNLHEVLRKRGNLSKQEFLVAVELWLGEMHGEKLARPSIKALIVEAEDYEQAKRKYTFEDPLPVKVVDLELSMEEFLLLFKRFAVSMSWQDLDLTGREYTE